MQSNKEYFPYIQLLVFCFKNGIRSTNLEWELPQCQKSGLSWGQLATVSALPYRYLCSACSTAEIPSLVNLATRTWVCCMLSVLSSSHPEPVQRVRWVQWVLFGLLIGTYCSHQRLNKVPCSWIQHRDSSDGPGLPELALELSPRVLYANRFVSNFILLT